MSTSTGSRILFAPLPVTAVEATDEASGVEDFWSFMSGSLLGPGWGWGEKFRKDRRLRALGVEPIEQTYSQAVDPVTTPGRTSLDPLSCERHPSETALRAIDAVIGNYRRCSAKVTVDNPGVLVAHVTAAALAEHARLHGGRVHGSYGHVEILGTDWRDHVRSVSELLNGSPGADKTRAAMLAGHPGLRALYTDSWRQGRGATFTSAYRMMHEHSVARQARIEREAAFVTSSQYSQVFDLIGGSAR